MLLVPLVSRLRLYLVRFVPAWAEDVSLASTKTHSTNTLLYGSKFHGKGNIKLGTTPLCKHLKEIRPGKFITKLTHIFRLQWYPSFSLLPMPYAMRYSQATQRQIEYSKARTPISISLLDSSLELDLARSKPKQILPF